MKVSAQLKRNRMCLHRGRAEPAHEVSRQRKHAHFERHGNSDRPAELHHRKRPLPVETPPVAEQVKATELPVERNDCDQSPAHDEPR